MPRLARRLELLGDSLRESLVGDDLDRYLPLLEPLAQEHELMDVALAACVPWVKAVRGASALASVMH